MINVIATIGGVFVMLSFLHFIVDWGFQTDREARKKATNSKIRARHCVVYTLPFLPVLFLMISNVYVIAVLLLVLFISHYVIDTYIPAFLWAVYFRKIPGLKYTWEKRGRKIIAFRSMWADPLYAILFIVIDQILHLIFVLLVSIVVVLL